MSVLQTPPIKVLLLSRFPIVIYGLERLLENHCPAIKVVGAATDREAAIAALTKQTPDVVLIEISTTAGLEIIAELLAALPGRVLVMTDSNDTEVIDGAVALGASGIVKKTDPVDVYYKALERVAHGELWLDRVTTGRVFQQMLRKKPDPKQSSEQTRIATLTRKERLTVVEIGRDASASTPEIAARLHISDHTLRNHLTSIYAKLALSNRVELYAFANRNDIKP
ncbi:MAG: response regulator transcription factor [Gammaproteobacteria bacterium]|nr:response regulator transcription factor [Gammaproteobacteria bacterium]MDP2348223.1 response regulator transcription factor [Gammaproteobacteria bacterium]